MICERSRDAALPMLACEIPRLRSPQTTLTDAMTQHSQSFASWYEERHGYPPFPWQAALAGRIAAGGLAGRPDAADRQRQDGRDRCLVVGSAAGLPVPRRLVYVIDRRLVVDGVSEYANALAASLDAQQQPTVVTMRGGMTIEEDWLSDPLRLAVIISTVDQVGSRLLFSGYGISPKAASIHAGSARQRRALRGRRGPSGTTAAPDPGQRCGATGKCPAAAVARPADVRHLGGRQHPWPQRRRLGASRTVAPAQGRKPALLIKLAADAVLTRTLADEALRLRQEGAGVVAVVCNRVDRARAVFEHLQGHGEAVLLTGRIRPCDKATLTEEYLPRMAVGSRGRRTPLFVVATQTIEVGADLDMDGLVTECAPLSALRQRFGRLNRLGELASAPAVIVYQTPEKKSDPIYGEDIERAWKWLDAVATGKPKTVDFGIGAMDRVMAEQPPPQKTSRRPRPCCPLTSTCCRGHPSATASMSPPGCTAGNLGSADVYLCWRADWAKASIEAAPPGPARAVGGAALRAAALERRNRRRRRRRTGRARHHAARASASAGTARRRRISAPERRRPEIPWCYRRGRAAATGTAGHRAPRPRSPMSATRRGGSDCIRRSSGVGRRDSRAAGR
jgi:CRISPR-associated endonuclease/helicase Cas3